MPVCGEIHFLLQLQIWVSNTELPWCMLILYLWIYDYVAKHIDSLNLTIGRIPVSGDYSGYKIGWRK